MQDSLSRTPTASEWAQLFKIAKEQAMIGFCFDGVAKLPQNQQPAPNILFEWLAMADAVRKRSEMLNSRCVDIQQKLLDDGFGPLAILKGQGNAMMYPNPLSRQGGDIDVWVSATKESTMEYCRKFAQGEPESTFEHVLLNIYGDPEVEMHFSIGPACGLISKNIEKWFKREMPSHVASITLPNGGSISVPDTIANIVHQTSHIYHHFVADGVGMRQVLDYYMLIKKAKQEHTDFDAVSKILKALHLLAMSRAVIYLIEKILGLPQGEMPWKPDTGYGKLLLDTMIKGGNFGMYGGNFIIGNLKTLPAMCKRAKMYLLNLRYLPHDPLLAATCVVRVINGFIKKTKQYFKGELK